MIQDEPGLRVKLKVDYTKYDRRLPLGSEGSTTIPMGRSAFDKNTFVRVAFDVPGGLPVNIDVQRPDLEIVDPRWVAWKCKEELDRADALMHHVHAATHVTTRRGKFMELVVEYSHGRPNDVWKKASEAKPFIEDLEKRGLLQEQIVKED